MCKNSTNGFLDKKKIKISTYVNCQESSINHENDNRSTTNYEVQILFVGIKF